MLDDFRNDLLLLKHLTFCILVTHGSNTVVYLHSVQKFNVYNLFQRAVLVPKDSVLKIFPLISLG